MGIPVANANLSYDQLIGQIAPRKNQRKSQPQKQQPVTAPTPKKEKLGLFGFIKKIMAPPPKLEAQKDKTVAAPKSSSKVGDEPTKQKANLEAVPPKSAGIASGSALTQKSPAIEAAPTEAAPRPSQLKPSIPETAPEIIDLSNSSDELSKILDQIIGDTQFDYEPVKVEKPKSPERLSSEHGDLEFTVEFEGEDESDEGEQEEREEPAELESEELLNPTSAEASDPEDFSSDSAEPAETQSSTEADEPYTRSETELSTNSASLPGTEEPETVVSADHASYQAADSVETEQDHSDQLLADHTPNIVTVEQTEIIEIKDSLGQIDQARNSESVPIVAIEQTPESEEQHPEFEQIDSPDIYQTSSHLQEVWSTGALAEARQEIPTNIELPRQNITELAELKLPWKQEESSIFTRAHVALDAQEALTESVGSQVFDEPETEAVQAEHTEEVVDTPPDPNYTPVTAKDPNQNVDLEVLERTSRFLHELEANVVETPQFEAEQSRLPGQELHSLDELETAEDSEVTDLVEASNDSDLSSEFKIPEMLVKPIETFTASTSQATLGTSTSEVQPSQLHSEPVPRSVPEALEPTESLVATSDLANFCGNGTALLFQEAFSELESLDDDNFEITHDALQPTTKPDELEVIFDFAYRAIERPELEQEYKEQVRATPIQVQTTALTRELEKVEKVLNTPLVTLKATHIWQQSLRDPGMSDQVANIEQPESGYKVATTKTRASAFLIDLGWSLVWALTLAVCYVWFFEPRLKDLVFSPRNWDALDKIAFFGIFLVALCVAGFMYQFFFLSVFLSTPGKNRSYLKIVRANGAELAFENIMIRCLCYQISILCFGWLPLFYKRRSLHDYLAGTTVVSLGKRPRKIVRDGG